MLASSSLMSFANSVFKLSLEMHCPNDKPTCRRRSIMLIAEVVVSDFILVLSFDSVPYKGVFELHFDTVVPKGK